MKIGIDCTNRHENHYPKTEAVDPELDDNERTTPMRKKGRQNRNMSQHMMGSMGVTDVVLFYYINGSLFADMRIPVSKSEAEISGWRRRLYRRLSVAD